jgi:hypothetical protein
MEGVLNESDLDPLPLHHRRYSSTVSLYHVYRAPRDYVEVEADSAFEAISRSEIHKPFKISRYAIRHLSVLAREMLTTEEEAVPETAIAEDAPVETAPES